VTLVKPSTASRFVVSSAIPKAAMPHPRLSLLRATTTVARVLP
jgi:hypothetical protein